jgi:ABC-type branched-subunit amino acid transport system substrate-binding protein
MNTRIASILLILFSTLCIAARAQEAAVFDPAADALFADALDRFDRHDYAHAARLFTEALSKPVVHHRTTASYVMAARSCFLAADHQRCIALLREFLERFPGSEYVRVANEFLGDAYRRTGDDYLALRAFVRAYRIADRPDDRRVYLDHIGAICQSGLRLPTLINVMEEFRGEDVYAIVLMQWADFAWDVGEENDALRAFRMLPSVVGDPDWSARKSGLAQKFGVPLGAVVLGVILPSPTGMEAAGEIRDFRDGILTAVEAFRTGDRIQVDVSVQYAPIADSIAGLHHQFASDPAVVGVVGGVYGADARSLARAASQTSVPTMLAAVLPDSVPSTRNVFQLSAPAWVRGELMARFVAGNWPSGTVAVLAPLQSPARDIAQGFVEALKNMRRGPSVVSWYAPESGDLRLQFKTIADKLSGNDSLAVIFAPLTTNSGITTVLSGYLASGLRSVLVGAGAWDRPELLQQWPLRRPIYFESDAYLPAKNDAARRFESAYLNLTQRTASHQAARGYDAAMFFLSALTSGSLQREHIADRLRTVAFGLHGPLAFRGCQANRGIAVYRYDGRAVHTYTTIPEE